MNMKKIYLMIVAALLSAACGREDGVETAEPVPGADMYDLKEYRVERHPPVVRNGFGMDVYHSGNASSDTLYLDTDLPPYHPNNPGAEGGTITKTDAETGEVVPFEYDLLFYNEFTYVPQITGDYSNTGYPVIFMYTDPSNAEKSVKAVMVGQGIACFNAFTANSINRYRSGLKSDPPVDLPACRTELHTGSVDGFILLQDNADALYSRLVIGNKFRPNIGGVFDLPDVSDEAQIDMQPVFLVQTREGLFAKFMVTRFKGVGVDTQKLTLQWKALQQSRNS
jgi:predicted small secreted protein